jgi:2-oxoglutarate ferredoxin oxidoreductase subunit alpha
MPDSHVADKFLMDGNAAAALGATFGGCSFIAWYPITPSTSVVDAARGYMAEYRHNSEGKPTYAIVQAEDELAAIGMVIGAGWAGARSMTATSGPGISLMAEFAGMAFFAEIPSVIWDIQRMGPSTGLPTRTSQGDIKFAHYLGHGDTRQIVLLPGSIKECFEFGWRAFDVAERFQSLVLVLSDLDLGMNLWTSDDFEYPDAPMDRGKIMTAEEIQKPGDFYRYLDKDEDGITYRTLPGSGGPYGAYFTRGTGHDRYGVYSEDSEDWVENLERLYKKMDLAREELPQPVVDRHENAKFGIISYGSNDPAIIEARDILAAQGIHTDYLRIRSLPLGSAVHDFVNEYDHVYLVENNFEGQMAEILRTDMPNRAADIHSVNMCNGLPLTAQFIVDQITEMEG